VENGSRVIYEAKTNNLTEKTDCKKLLEKEKLLVFNICA
jgi:hypothetical protein